MHYNDWLAKRERYTPDQEAVVDLSDSGRYTYRELNQRANSLAISGQTAWLAFFKIHSV